MASANLALTGGERADFSFSRLNDCQRADAAGADAAMRLSQQQRGCTAVGRAMRAGARRAYVAYRTEVDFPAD